MISSTLKNCPEFFSCDWGTTSFRLRQVIRATNSVIAEIEEASGVRALLASCPTGAAAEREKAFSNFLADRLKTLLSSRTVQSPVVVVVSGMASSSVGWRELPYARTPFPLDGSQTGYERIELELGTGLSAEVFLISGIQTETEIMRGEETELLGVFAGSEYTEIALDGLVLLPGTHSKHVRLKDRAIVDVGTYMTGELFDILSTHSLLRASVSKSSATLSGEAAREHFTQGVHLVAKKGLPGCLFQVRTRAVLKGVDHELNRWFLSGLLIGSEVEYLLGAHPPIPILVAAPPSTGDAYRLAFEALGIAGAVSFVPPEQMKQTSLGGHKVMLEHGFA
jgi:2-dehydro-3-deoxygalactonokinase